MKDGVCSKSYIHAPIKPVQIFRARSGIHSDNFNKITLGANTLLKLSKAYLIRKIKNNSAILFSFIKYLCPDLKYFKCLKS